MGREMASAFARWCTLEEIGVTPVLTAVADLSEPVLAWFDRIPTDTSPSRSPRGPASARLSANTIGSASSVSRTEASSAACTMAELPWVR